MAGYKGIGQRSSRTFPTSIGRPKLLAIQYTVHYTVEMELEGDNECYLDVYCFTHFEV